MCSREECHKSDCVEGDKWDLDSCNPKECVNGKVVETVKECPPITCENGIMVSREGQCCAECVKIPPFRLVGEVCDAGHFCSPELACQNHVCVSVILPANPGLNPAVIPAIPQQPTLPDSDSDAFAYECGDMNRKQCDLIPWCLWLVKENECDEVKEMDCQDLNEEACGEELQCAWVFDDRYLCIEKKEVESSIMDPSQFPPAHTLKNAKQDKAEPESTIPTWQLLLVLASCICFGFTCTQICMNSLKKHDKELLLAGAV